MILGLLLLLWGPDPEESAFQSWFTERGVAVSIARQVKGPAWIRAVAELPVSPDALIGVVTHYEGYGETFAPFIAKISVLERREDAARLHIVWEYPFPYRDRDAVVLYEVTRHAEGGYRLSWSSASRPGDPSEGVRIGRVVGETRIEPAGEKRTRLTYTFLGDLGGRFPRFAEEKAWRKEPVAYVLAIRRRLGLSERSGAP